MSSVSHRMAATAEGEPPTSGLGERATRAVLWRSLELCLTRVVSLGRFLVLARLLAPEDFGLLAIAAAAIELLMTLTEIGVTRALVQRPHATRRDYDVAWTLGLARAGLVFVVVAATAPQLASLFGDERATGILLGLSLQPVLAALESARVPWLMRHLRFSAVSGLNLASAVVEALMAVALASVLGVSALVVAALTSAAVRSTLSYVVAPHRPRLDWERRTANELLDFGKWVFFGYLFAVLGDTAIRAAIGRQLGAAELGLYFLAARFALLPNQVAAELVTPVAFSVHAQHREAPDASTKTFVASATGMLVLLGPVTGVIAALAPGLVEDVLGPDWQGAAVVLGLLAVDGLISVPVDLTEPMLEGRGRPELVAALRGVRAGGVLLLVWWLTGVFGLVGAALAALAAEAAIAAAATYLARDTWRPASRQLRNLVAATLAASGTAGGVALIVDLLSPGVVGVLLGCGIGAACGWMVVAGLDRPLQLGVRPIVEVAIRALRRGGAAPARAAV